MSATFFWEKVKQGHAFQHGTSSDREALEETFREIITAKDIPILQAMHRAAGDKESLWSDIVDVLNGLPEDAAIKVWVEY